MMSYEKRLPAFTDTDMMPFGKHIGEQLQDVPPKYLAWLKDELAPDFHKADPEKCSGSSLTRLMLYNYIHNSWDAIQMELNL